MATRVSDMTGQSTGTPGRTSRGHIPGEEGIWVFIGGDLLAFAVFFITYAVARRQELPVFETSQRLLDRDLGLARGLVRGMHRVQRPTWVAKGFKGLDHH